MKSMLIKSDNIAALKALQENYSGKIDLVYIDIPYNTQQKFTVSKTKKSSISRSKNGEIAYSDDMDFKSFLDYIRSALMEIWPLISKRGSIYLHIDCKTGHYIKIIMDEVFGMDCFRNDIARIKSNPKNFKRRAWGNQRDMILFYAMSKKNIWNDIKMPLSDKDRQRFKKKDEKGYYTTVPCHAPGETKDGDSGKEWKGRMPPEGRHWRFSPSELDKLDEQGLIEWSSTGNPRIKNYFDGHAGKKWQDVWEFKDPQNANYPTEKNLDMLRLIVSQSSSENSIVLDCFCGSGTTLLAAAQLGRTFIGIDNSEAAIRQSREKLDGIEYVFIESAAKLDADPENNYSSMQKTEKFGLSFVREGK